MEAETLWDTYKSKPTIQNRNNLVLHYLGQVDQLAKRQHRRIPSRQCTIADLVSYGVVGLIEAIDRYNAQLGEFQSYASRRVVGAMLDGLREMKWSQRRSQVQVKTNVDLYPLDTDSRSIRTVDDRDELEHAFRNLDRREFFVAIAYYLHERSQNRVAEYLGCSRSTVGRILSKIEDVFQEAV